LEIVLWCLNNQHNVQIYNQNLDMNIVSIIWAWRYSKWKMFELQVVDLIEIISNE
jgi:hypothetical protein